MTSPTSQNTEGQGGSPKPLHFLPPLEGLLPQAAPRPASSCSHRTSPHPAALTPDRLQLPLALALNRTAVRKPEDMGEEAPAERPESERSTRLLRSLLTSDLVTVITHCVPATLRAILHVAADAHCSLP